MELGLSSSTNSLTSAIVLSIESSASDAVLDLESRSQVVFKSSAFELKFVAAALMTSKAGFRACPSSIPTASTSLSLIASGIDSASSLIARMVSLAARST